MAVTFSGAMPPKSGLKREVVRVTTAERQDFLILSRSIYGQWIHYYGNRSHECSADRGECQGCHKSWPRRWKGYLDCIREQTGERVFLEFTAACAEQIWACLEGALELRGSRFRIWKTKGGAKGRYCVEYREYQRKDDGQIPIPEDPLPLLRFLWQCKNSVGGTK
jgi:hypothetical protein